MYTEYFLNLINFLIEWVWLVVSYGYGALWFFSVGQPSQLFYFEPEVTFSTKWPTFFENMVLEESVDPAITVGLFKCFIDF